MATSAKRTLLTMTAAHLQTRDPAEDIRNRKVVDAAGEEIGKVEGLLIDNVEEKVRFLQIASGGFLGLGKSTVLVPVEAITRISDDIVYIDQTREHIAGAPTYAPELVNDLYYEGLYGYYGYAPYWSLGYTYPPFPSYPNMVHGLT